MHAHVQLRLAAGGGGGGVGGGVGWGGRRGGGMARRLPRGHPARHLPLALWMEQDLRALVALGIQSDMAPVGQLE